MTRIAILQSNADAAEQHARHLRQAGQEVRILDGWKALHEALPRFEPQLLVLDEQMPGGDVLKLVTQLRQQQPELGLVLINRSIRPADRLAAWRAGADHVLAEPVLVDELVLVVRNLSRRITPEAQTAWTLDLPRMRLTAPEGHDAALTHSEAAILQAIARAVHQRCDRPQLAEALGQDWRTYDERRLEALMSRLRRKLTQATGREVPLRALRGQGYGFVEPLTLR